MFLGCFRGGGVIKILFCGARDITNSLFIVSEKTLYTEFDLIERLAIGDQRAFEMMYELYSQKVYGYIESIVKSPEVSEEITIDIFLKLWLSRERLSDVRNLGAFLRTVSRNKALDYLKVTARDRQRREAYRNDMAARASAAEVNAPDAGLFTKELLQIRQESLARLSPRRRKIFLMHREGGLSHHEIAEKLNLSPHTVKKTISQALASISDYFQRHYYRYVEVGVILLQLLALSGMRVSSFF